MIVLRHHEDITTADEFWKKKKKNIHNRDQFTSENVCVRLHQNLIESISVYGTMLQAAVCGVWCLRR